MDQSVSFGKELGKIKWQESIVIDDLESEKQIKERIIELFIVQLLVSLKTNILISCIEMVQLLPNSFVAMLIIYKSHAEI